MPSFTAELSKASHACPCQPLQALQPAAHLHKHSAQRGHWDTDGEKRHRLRWIPNNTCHVAT